MNLLSWSFNGNKYIDNLGQGKWNPWVIGLQDQELKSQEIWFREWRVFRLPEDWAYWEWRLRRRLRSQENFGYHAGDSGFDSITNC